MPAIARCRQMLLLVVALLVAALAAPAATAQEASDGRYRDFGDPGGFLNIVPPGQDGSLNAAEAAAARRGTLPAYFNDQTPLYENLLYLAGLPTDADPVALEHLERATDGDLASFFKDASFGDEGEPARTYSPSEGLTIVRDSEHGVPHIFGETREAAMFGAGFAVAEDRLFLMDVLRHLGRARLSEFLGASESNKNADRAQLKVAPYKEEELTAQVQAICDSGEEGQRACDDLDAYSAGVNAYIAAARRDQSLLPAEYPALQQMPADWRNEDVVAIASLVGGIFGKGGGAEVASGRFLAQLQAEYGEAEGRAIWVDFRSANDPEAPHTTEKAFPYNNPDPARLDPDSTALLDLATVDETMSQMAPSALVVDGPLGPIDLRSGFGMSNAILASGEVTDGGVPIALFGPQTGYFTPQLLWEMDIHGPGIDARGVAFAGTNIYVQLGRGRDYAWSATSAGGDNVDEWVLELCNPDGSEPTAAAQAYVYDGECKPMDTFTHRQVAKPSAAGVPSPGGEPIVFDIPVERTVYGPVVARGTVDGKPVAISTQRSTYGAELDSAIGFQRINDPAYMSDGVESFKTAFDGVDYTFNWFYVDQTAIGYKHSCKCPIRDPRTNPDLPTWGTGEYDWTGEFLAPEDQPQDVNPESGFFANWNNKQAPQFRANDAQYNYSSTYRSEFLRVRMADAIASGRKLTRGDMVNIMMDAGTVDLNGQEIYPLVLRVLGNDFTSDDARVNAMVEQLRTWVAAGGHRRDADRDGTYDHAVAVSIGDALLRPLLDGVFGDELAGADLPQRVEDHPRAGVGSAYNGGQANFLDKDFRQVLAAPIIGPRSRTYCGGGDLGECRDVVVAALTEAADALEEAFGSAEVETWVYDDAQDQIPQRAIGLTAAPNMQWVNRPTYQQVAQPGSLVGRIDGANRVATSAALSRQAFADGAGTVVIASAENFPDALAGAPLAVARQAPLLLTASAGLSLETAREIARLDPNTAILLGGPAALSDQVDADLRAAGVEEVARISGANRYETAAAIAESYAPDATAAIVASGETFPDALAAGPLAAVTNRPLLLVARDTLPEATATALEGVTEVLVAGGRAAVAESVEAAVAEQGADVRRVAGATRYETGRLLTREALDAENGATVETAYAVTGENFPDALSAGAAAGQRGAALLLVAPTGLRHSAGSGDVVDSGETQQLWLVGGQAALPSALRAELETALRTP
jgi:acyl-homoserine lactone acylase PvdQ